MRRSEKEITDKSAIEAVIEQAKVCRLGLVDDGQPYLVPLCFGYQDEVLYFHSALEGRKIDIIKKSPKACFEVDVDVKVVEAKEACGWSVKYKSVIGFGKVSLIEKPAEKKEAFALIMAQYSSEQFDIPEKSIERTAMIKMAIEEMVGKSS